MAQRLKTDKILFITVVLMVLFGSLMVYSASSVVAESRYGSSYYFAIRQLVWLVLAIPLMLFFKYLHYRKLQKPEVAFTAMAIIMVLLVVVYFIGNQHRWIRLPGFELQPSEFAKPALIIFLAYFIAMRSNALNSKHTLLPAIIAVGSLTFGVVIADLGTAIVLVLTAAVVFFVAGLEMRYVWFAAGIILLVAIGAVWQRPYRLGRIVRFVDPTFTIVDKFDKHGWIKARMKSATTTDTNYQANQAKIAVGSGGPVGVGLMEGRQKLFYLPEAHTDTIYAVIGEEWGLFGTMGVLIGFLIVLWRGLRATVLVHDEFGRYLALGITV